MNLLFVCTGNTCRSAMAEPLMRKRLEEAGLGGKINVRSAGVAAYAGQGASKGTQHVLKTRGLDGGAHQATLLDASVVKWADLILTMSESHKRAILERHIEEAFDKTFTLKEFVDDDPANIAILNEMNEVQAEAQTKQSLWIAEHADELDALQERYVAGDKSAEAELGKLQQQLEQSVQQEAKRLGELVGKLPDYDIADPYGGAQDVYDRTAIEVEMLLEKLVVRLKDEV